MNDYVAAFEIMQQGYILECQILWSQTSITQVD